MFSSFLYWINVNTIIYIALPPLQDTVVHFHNTFSHNTQQDGHEMLLYLLDALHDGLNSVTKIQ